MKLIPDQATSFRENVNDYLVSRTRMEAAQRDSLVGLARSLLARLKGTDQCFIGLAGAPGCGKSTLANALAHGLTAIGIPALALSMDDYYLPLARRKQMAVIHHPLFRQRGVPGTHELDRLMEDLDRIRLGNVAGMQIPRFDKSTDDRVPRRLWRRLEGEVAVVLLEGWCISAPPPAEAEWDAAVDATRSIEDGDKRWRRRVHYSWTDYYLALSRRLDEIWYIRVPDWNCVLEWRWQQECELASRHLESPDAVREFLAPFEPIVKHMQHSYRQWADLTLVADRSHMLRLEDNQKTSN